MRGNHPPDIPYHVEGGRGMLDDNHWGQFTSDANHYELGSAIGFGASSTVYSAIFTLPQQINSSPSTPEPLISPPASTQQSSSARRGRPELSITLPQPTNHDFHSNLHLATETGDKVVEISCAVKVSTSHPDVDQLFKEIRLLALCRHPNVLRILSTFTLPPDHHRIAIITPLVSGGSLAGILDWRSRLSSTPKHRHFPHFRRHRDRDDEEDEQSESSGRLEEEEIKAVTKQVLEGLNYLHQTGFLHRDLKAGNLLIDQGGTILLADFGVGADLNVPCSPVYSRHTRPTADTLRFDEGSAKTGYGPGKRAISSSESRVDMGKRKSFVGTPNWMAPEIVLGQKYDSKADIWSLGITILELAHGSAPGSKSKPNDILARIVTGAPPTLDRSIGGFSKQMKDFVDACLVKHPEHRPSAAQLAEHAWLKGAKKKAYLAQSLIADVPPLYQRQELRRIPTMSSLISRASSWDFSATPTPSMPSSPIQTSNSLLLSARTPSVLAHSHNGAEYFSSIGQSRSHSRNSSFSHGAAALPPSPRVSLRQWAERSATSTSDHELPSLGRRTGSEQGKMRSSSSMSMRMSTSTSRLGKSASFDIQRGRTKPTLGVGMEQGANRRSGLFISPSTTRRDLQTSTKDHLTEDGSSLSTATKETTPMTPLLEISVSHDREQVQEKLDDIVKLDLSQSEDEQPDLFSSPEVIGSNLPHDEVTPTSHSKRHLDSTSQLVQNNDAPMSSDDDHRRSSTPVEDITTPRRLSNGAIDTTLVPVQADGLTVNINADNRNPKSLRPQSNNGVKTMNQCSIPMDKKNWLGRKVSVSNSNSNSGKNKISQVGMGMGITSTRVGGREDIGATSASMGKTASWTSVFGKVAGKIQKDKR